jgi:4-amino-4-deoxy-L-arabinose transferase-like glycosyltransferase
VKTRLLSTSTTVGFSKNKANVKFFFNQHYPLIAILLGFILVSMSVGPFHNGDSAWEYDATSGVTKYGLPFANESYLINQPPLGFYIQASFLSTVGSSINNGTFLVTLFGLGCIILVFLIGNTIYNRTTGYFAALLIAFSSWHIILSRTFLIDTLCLFFSLLSLFVGIIAIRKDSIKLLIASGLIFAAAFNTKLYAIFILVPLFALFLYFGPRKVKRIGIWVTVFSLPTLLTSYLWYETITGVGLNAILNHADFVIHEPTSIVPSYSFVSNFLVSYGLGWFFIDATILSLIVCLALRRTSPRLMVFDSICIATIAVVAGINIFLGTTLDLKAPYLNAVKYEYQALPFFCLLAASLITKSISMFNLSKAKPKKRKLVGYFVSAAGFALLAATIFYNMNYIHLISQWDYLLFRVEPNVNFGYSLFNSTPTPPSSILMQLQYFGFALAFSSLIWIGKPKIKSMLSNRQKKHRKK